MNCRNLEERLSEGTPLTAESKAHLQSCVGCRSLVNALEHQEYQIGAEVMSRITATLTRQLSPVTPLPSDGTLTLLIFASFVAFCLILTATVGFFGYAAMTGGESAVYCGILGIFGLLFSSSAVASAIPAGKVRMPAYLVIGASVAITGLAVSVMFPGFTTEHFVRRGIPCLRLGCICAVLFGILAGLLLRRGYITDRWRTALVISCFAGFSGVAVLGLHCPLLNAPHIIVWHLGTMAVSALVGLAIAAFFSSKA
jgi:hypothetical protein